MKLEEIGFHSLTDERAINISATSRLWRACFLVTGRCNFLCPYCVGLKTDSDMKLDFFLEILKGMSKPPHSLKTIRFSGGEPTIHKDIVEMISLSKTANVERIGMSTNGFADKELYAAIVDAGVNDFSISFDADNELLGDELTGGIKGAWKKVISNISYLASRTYVILGITIGAYNADKMPEIVSFADSLGVADMKVSTDASWNKPIPRLDEVKDEILARHPVLKYRIEHFKKGRNVRGLRLGIDCSNCPLVMDDIIVVGEHHFPCLVYAREKGKPIGEMTSDLARVREERKEWGTKKDTFSDFICRNYCMDIFIDCNNRINQLQAEK